MGPPGPRVCIVVPNWNGWRDTIECLDSLFKMDFSHFDVIVVDNGSSDESMEQITDFCQTQRELYGHDLGFHFSSVGYREGQVEPNSALTHLERSHLDSAERQQNQVVLVSNDSNLGYAKAINIGIELGFAYLHPDNFLLMNNDVVVDKNLLNDLLEVAEENQGAGIIGPTVFWLNEKDKIQSVGHLVSWMKGMGSRIMLEESVISRGGTIEADCISGCAMFAPSALVRQIGLFKSEYFAYWEDVEWCLRAKKYGFKVLVATKARVWHKGSASSKKISGFYVYHLTRNMFWFMRSWLKDGKYWIFLMYFFLVRFWMVDTRWILQRHGGFNEYRVFLRAIRDGLLAQPPGAGEEPTAGVFIAAD